MQHDAWFFVGVFAFIFLVWVATGGPAHPLAFSGPSLNQPEELGGGDYLSLPRSPFRIGGSHTALPGSSRSGSGYSYTAGSVSSYSATFGSPSSYTSSLSLTSRVSNASSSDPQREYVQLTAPKQAGVLLDISGWKLVSDVTGKAAAIPRGTLIPTLGIVNPLQDIVLAPGERAFVVSGISPVGASFRENKCVGYMNTFQDFTPSLSSTCPSPMSELAAYYGDYYIRDTDCVDYVKKIPRCTTTLFPPKRLSSSCKAFVQQRLNYNGCVAAHKTDTDFAGKTWRIYLGLDEHLWRAKNEVVKLLDYSGNTVSAFRY